MEVEKHSQPLRIDLGAILSRRMKSRPPRFIIALLERIIRQKGLNAILKEAFPAAGADFAARVLEYLEIDVKAEGLDNLPPGRYIFASNHPLGGLDGIALIALLGRKYSSGNIRFPVNDMLMHVRPLKHVFMPINKYGAQGREAAAALDEVYRSEMQMIIFPAGLVSRLQPDGSVADLKWHKHFVAKARAFDREIVPVRIEALNGGLFYRIAKWRKRLGIKVNLEQVLLPSELMKFRKKKIRILFGEPVSLEGDERRAEAVSADLRNRVYEM